VHKTVANIKSAVTPKCETLTESIIKLNKNTPIYIGIFLIKTADTTPNKKTAGKLISVVSISTAIKDAMIKKMINL
jgi:hypothetical protein